MKRIRILPAFLFLFLLGLLIVLSGQLWIKQNVGNFVEEAESQPANIIGDKLAEVLRGEDSNLFENTMRKYPTFDSKETYESFVNQILEHIDLDSLQYELVEETEEHQTYRVYGDEGFIGTFELDKDETNTWQLSFPLEGKETYLLEVPTGKKVSANGLAIGKEYCMEENVPASNFFQMPDQSSVPHVDVYELDHLLGYPAIALDGQDCAILEDVITGHLLVGKPVTDEQLKNEIIEDGQLLAQYPAQEVGLQAVANVSLTDTTWYQRYATLQNFWFTSHSISNFSNQEVLRIVAQSDDTVVSHVVFDYYADNGDVHRTWYIGYQMTMVKTANGWKIGGIQINNELNPRQIVPE